MSNRPVIPQEYQQADLPRGFTLGEWAEIKRLVDEGYARFWDKRGGIPNRSLAVNFSPDKNKEKETTTL